jgi:hypothetical protein
VALWQEEVPQALLPCLKLEILNDLGMGREALSCVSAYRLCENGVSRDAFLVDKRLDLWSVRFVRLREKRMCLTSSSVRCALALTLFTTAIGILADAGGVAIFAVRYAWNLVHGCCP